MPYVTYTAKRNIITVDFSASGTDISASDADNSFNSSTTDLSGLNADEWIEVVGTTSNDGWHQVSSDSTSTKIVTTSTLTTEAAGDNVSIDGYLHGKDQDYTIEFNSKRMAPSSEEDSEASVSIGGNVETLFNKEVFYWDIETTPIDQSNKKFWDEFFSSVMGGAQFTLDAYAVSEASTDNPQQVIREGGHKYTRVQLLEKFNVSFKARVL